MKPSTIPEEQTQPLPQAASATGQPSSPADLCREAKKLMRLFDLEGYVEAVVRFQHALEKAPSFAPACAGIAETYSYWGFRRELNGQECESYYGLSYEYAGRALRLAPERGDSHRAMSVALRRGEKADPERSKEEVLLALDLNPNDAETWHQYWRAFGYNIADKAIHRAIELDPFLCGAYNDLAVVLCGCGRLDEAAQQLQLALRINPRNSLVHYNLAMILDRKGLRDKAAALLERTRRMHPGDPLVESGWALVGGGENAS